MKEIKEIFELYTESTTAKDIETLSICVSKMLGKMAKILVMIEDEEPLRKPLNRKFVLEIPATQIDHRKREKFLLYACYQNLQSGLFDNTGEWKHEAKKYGNRFYQAKENLDRLHPNIFQFCDIISEVFLGPRYEFDRLSELIFTLLEADYEEEAQLIQEALKALEEKASDYEFCGKIRSVLEKIVLRFVLLINEPDRTSFFNNLHTLVKRQYIEKKLYKPITGNYSYGSQFIHQEKPFNSSDVRLYIDQTLLHINRILEKMKEVESTRDSDETEENNS
ncbi:MAG: hypothetical protein ACFFD4_09635 [Candidatus Odinarchaeota archaeon]